MDICDAWADKRGFTTARGCRPDSYRAANELLRLSVEGKLVFSVRPPGYDDDAEEEEDGKEEERVEVDDDLAGVVNMVRSIQTAKKRNVERGSEVTKGEDEGVNSDEEEEEEDEEESPTVSRNAFALLGEGND